MRQIINKEEMKEMAQDARRALGRERERMMEEVQRVDELLGLLDTRRTSHMVSNWKLRKYISQISDLSFQKLKYTSPRAGRKFHAAKMTITTSATGS